MKEKNIKSVQDKNILKYIKKKAKKEKTNLDAGSDLFLTANITVKALFFWQNL